LTKIPVLALKLLPISQAAITFFFLCFNSGCGSSKLHKMENDITIIRNKMDEALLTDNPMEAYKKLLPEIMKDTLVDSAWITGYTVWVKFKEGGKMSWFVPVNDKVN